MAGAGNREQVAEAVGRGGAFPKAARLLRHSDFDHVYRQGRRLFSANMSVFWLRREPGQSAEPGVPESPKSPKPMASAGSPRVGFTVGRVLGGSVIRNRIRRRLREAVRLNLEGLAAPVDVVINPRKSARTADFAQLLQEVAEAFRAIEQGRGAKATRRAQ